MSAAYSIFMTLLAFSIGGWWIVLFATETKPVRDAVRGTFTKSAMPEGMNEKLLFASMIGGLVWAITPAILITNRKAIASALQMTNHPLWGVVLNCIASSIVLGIIGPIVCLFVRNQASDGIFSAKTEPRIKRFHQGCSNGIRGFILAAFPVTAVVFATSPLRTDAQHPLLKLLSEVPGPTTIGLVMFAAVILAPLVEELLFRVLLQLSLIHI